METPARLQDGRPRFAAKVLDLRDLAARLEGLKSAGKTVVHCHGVFDLLHVGHIRHFQEARSLGDILVVTLTPDRHVNKGPHRPAFPESLRAEALAALGTVDFVAINEWPKAVEAIKLLRPHVYVKGPDYRNGEKDITGGIAEEESAVLSVGGRIHFTEDITFSSSNLLNRHIPVFEPSVQRYLGDFRKRYSIGDIFSFLDALKGLKVLVVGEAILDEYVYCDALGKSSKEPILAMLYAHRELHAGGSLAIANHIAEFCAEVDLLTFLGESNPQEEFVRASLKPNVRPVFVRKPASPTIVKRRFVERYMVTKMLEIYEMNDAPLSGEAEEALCSALETGLPRYDAVVVADFGHGLITPRAVALLSRKARFLAVNTQLNAANIGFHVIAKYPRADYVCIQEGELRMEHRSRQGDLRALLQGLAGRLGCASVMVTRGRDGTLIHRPPEDFVECPSFAVKVVDRIGAGDAVLSVTALCAARGVPGDALSFVGNLAGAQAVLIVGNRASIDATGLRKSVESMLK